MAKNQSMDKLLSQSRLFDDATGELDYSKLTPDQQIALQRQGRTARVNDLNPTARGISSSTSNVENAILDEAGAQLASGDSLIVSNTQRRNTQRLDERSRGGERLSSLLSKNRTDQGRTAVTAGMVNSVGAKGLGMIKNLLTKAGKGIKDSNKLNSNSTLDSFDSANIGEGISKITNTKPYETGFKGAEQLYGNQGPASNINSGIGLEDIAGSITSEITPISTGAGGINSGALGIGNPTSYGGAAFSSAGSLGAMGAANTAATGGLVGGADIAGLAAAEAGAAGGAGAGALSGALQMAGPIGMIASALYTIGSGVYNMHHRPEKTMMDTRKTLDILEAGGPSGKDEMGKDWVIQKDDQGNRYLRDPVTLNNYGEERWIPLDNPEFADQVREIYSKNQSRNTTLGIHGRDEKQEYMNAPQTASDMSTRDRHEGGQKMNQLDSLSGIRTAQTSYNSKGKSGANIENFYKGIGQQYRDWTQDKNSVAATGKG